MARVWRAATVVTLVMASLGLIAASAEASAETLYVTSYSDNDPGIYPVPLATLTTGTRVPTLNFPEAIAISPDARTAYTADNIQGSTPATSYIDLATGTAVGRIDISNLTSPGSIAVSPDGSQLYVGNVTGSTVVVFDARDSTAPDSVIHVGGDPTGIAFTPDGRFAYVANETSGTVSVVNTATRTVPTFVPANTLPNAACGLAITPDGAKIVVIGGCGTVTSGGIGIIDTATNTATPITGLTSPNDPYEAVAMAPDGTKAYAYDRMKGDIEVVDPRTGTAASTPLVHGLAGFEGLAVSPDGKFLFATASLSGGAVRIDTTTGTRTTISPVATKPWAAAITPDQPPHAAFSVTLGPLGTATAFDASATTTSDGGPATYTWDFGDGASATTATPSTSHVYSQPGSYTATLTVTDDQGCSTTFVYTGQTALCNGGSSAVAARNVTILPARTLTVSVSGRGKVTGTGISCPGDCSQAYADGTHVTLTATPTASSRFKGWGGACRGSGNCKLNMKADKSVSAKFGASPPDTRITKARIVRRTAKFKFKPIGNATGVKCELKRKHGHKKPRFRRCKSPKAYKHLKKGKYTFKVRAFSSAGPDPTPARKRFKVK